MTIQSKEVFKIKLGFTLVELLVVMAIIAILTTMISAGFAESQKKARDVRRKADLVSISKSLNMYYNDYGKYPNGQSGEPAMESLVENGGEFKMGDNIYMKVVPHESINGVSDYSYFVGGSGKSFRVWANLENDDDKDCIPYATTIVDDYSGTANDGCLYAVYSSNVGVTTTLF